MPVNVRRKTYGLAADRRALLTEHAVEDGIGCTLTASAFTGKPGVVDNVVPALYPIVVDSAGKATPFAGTVGTPAALSGFTINPVDISNGDDVTGYMWHGTYDPTLLPVTFDPAAVAATSAQRFYFNGKA